MTGLLSLNPKSSEIDRFFRMILVVYLGHWMFHPVAAVLFFCKSFSLGEVLSFPK